MIQVNDLVRVVAGYGHVGEVGLVRVVGPHSVIVQLRPFEAAFNINHVEKVSDAATLDEAKEALRLYQESPPHVQRRRQTQLLGRLATFAIYMFDERTSDTQADTFSQRDAMPTVAPPAKT